MTDSFNAPVQCWICGSSADSAEHRIKKKDLTRAYGQGPYAGVTAISHFRDGTETRVQGPSSKTLKYPPSLCRHCNNAGTQPFDRAYDRFIDYVLDQEPAILQRRVIDFADVFGDTWETSQRNLFKYFAKSFGCRLAGEPNPVPNDVRDLLAKARFETCLQLSMAVNEDILIMPPVDRATFIGKGNLIAWAPRSQPQDTSGYTWDEHVSWLTVFYWYNKQPDENRGSPWVANSQYTYLGSISPLSPEMREEFTKKATLRQAEIEHQPELDR